MFVPLKETKCEYSIKKSRFIAIFFPFTNVNSLEGKLKKIKTLYPKASHYLYLYKVNQLIKGNDDNEPGKITHGIVRLLNQHNLNKILVVIVRHFGGIKLGASNLLRTYLDVVNIGIKNLSVGEEREVYRYHGVVDYATFNKLKRAGYLIENVRYFVKIEIDIISNTEIFHSLKQFPIENLSKQKEIRLVHEQSK